MRKTKVACGVILDAFGRVLITQRGDKDNFGKWEFPGGKFKTNETYNVAIQREINEELDLIVEASHEIESYDIYVNSEIYTLVFIQCNYLKGKISLKEHIQYNWVMKSELSNYDFIEGDKKFIKNTFSSKTW